MVLVTAGSLLLKFREADTEFGITRAILWWLTSLPDSPTTKLGTLHPMLLKAVASAYRATQK